MIINKLILKGYKRFLLSNIDKLEYTPNNSIQIIASRNLAGKSSLLRQLNPLPADIKKEFQEDGYKHIELTHNNNQYVLINSNKNNFICNGVELNPSGNKKTQLDLVKEHFKITPSIMDVIYNVSRLTTMSPLERKNWFTEMSSIDYNFSITVYKKLKQRHRDIIGGIKLLQESIIQNELNITTKEELDKLKENKNTLSNYIDHLISLYEHKHYDVDDNYKDTLVNNTKILESLLQKDNIDGNIESIKNTILKNEESIKSLITLITNTAKELEELNNLKKLGNIEDLEKELFNVKNELDNLNKFKLIEDDNYTNIYNNYVEIYRDLLSNVEELDNYKDCIEYTEEYVKELMNKKSNIEIKIQSLSRITILLEKDIEHMKKHKDNPSNNITCEKCNHSWIIGFNPIEYDKLLKDLVLNKETLSKLNIENDKLSKILDKYTKYKDVLSNIKTIMRSKPILLNTWKWLLEKVNINKIAPTEFIRYLNTINISLSKLVEIDKLKERESLLIKKIEYIKELNKTHKDIHKDKIDNLSNRLEDNIKLKNSLIIENNNLKNSLLIKEKIKSYYELNSSLIINYRKELENELILERNNSLQLLIKDLKTIMLEIEEKINTSIRLSDTISKSKLQLEEYKNKERVLNIMCKVLSPDEGLIAKSINGFINTILDEMNTIINSIWTYPLELLTCQVDDNNDLDYKFKVRVNNDHIIEDVSKLSSSGQEIVDLAFRLVFTKYMGLEDVPLFLDEFGSTFDKAHRTSAYSVIDKIIRSEYKQIFIVSHYDSIYGAFKNIDFNVLDSNNIDLDPSLDVNQVMKITRN